VAELALEERLVALGESMVFPDADSLVDDVLGELAGAAAGRGRRWLAVAAVLLAIVLAATAVVPASRRAIARWLGFDELRIEPVLELPTIPETAAADPGELPGPGDVVASTIVGGGGGGGVPVIVGELPGRLEPGLFTKLTTSRTTVTETTVGSRPAFWIAGEPHVLLYLDEDGDVVEGRMAGNVLVWQHGDTIRRIEGARSLEEARRLAAREWDWSGG
jgi:hypothetical protein